MTSKREVIRRQRRWATSAGLNPDSRGYLQTIEQNLYRPLSPGTLAAFSRGNGSELEETPRRPAKMRALHSSAALVVNVFDYCTAKAARPLLQALGLDSTLKSLELEAQVPTALAGTPPQLDVALTLESGELIAIESKFTEWMTSKPRTKPAFRDKYFAGSATLWRDVGLPACQALAMQLYEGALHFRHLDAAQLLKHALGLASQHRGNAALYYLYFDVPSRRSTRHREEIGEFASAIDTVLAFKAVAYQDLFNTLKTLEGIEPSYLAYLQSRYF